MEAWYNGRENGQERGKEHVHEMETGCILGLISLIQKSCMTLVF